MSDQSGQADLPTAPREVHQLQYGRPIYFDLTVPKKTITITLPLSFLLMVVQFPWFVVSGIPLELCRMGKQISLPLDSLITLAIAAPTLAAMIVMARQWLPSSAKKTNRASIFSVLAIIAAIASLCYQAGLWYHEIWLQRGGYWDSI